ncbi:PucR family transcriptional regulator [Nocardia salmonicida]|uniref:PucR family transcriptional regulator n=1 Tax=Nocardia salmonicida TaxID=53431 RepID=UPI000A8B8DE6|nr:helix-turn-helix domain-containing protein [Nocardia salmonicida]
MRGNDNGDVRALAEVCRADVPALTEQLITAVFTDNPDWTNYTSVPRAELRDACARYLSRILDRLSAAAPDHQPDEVAAAIGETRAAQGVPLEAILRTFQLGGRIMWEALLDHAETVAVTPREIRAAGTAMWTVVDGLSSALSTAYRAVDLVSREERRKYALIEDLLAGGAHDATFAARAGRELNIPLHTGYLVIVAEPLRDGRASMSGPETALAALGIRSVWHSRADTTIGLVSLADRDADAVLNYLRPLTRGRAAASPVVHGLTDVDSAHALARVALGTLSTHAVGLVSLSDRYPEALLFRSPDLAELLVAQVLGPILLLPTRERDALIRTLSEWLAHNCSASNAALRLHCHRNTVINRLQRISTLLDRPLEGQRTYVELSLALTSLELSRRTGSQRPPS